MLIELENMPFGLAQIHSVSIQSDWSTLLPSGTHRTYWLEIHGAVSGNITRFCTPGGMRYDDALRMHKKIYHLMTLTRRLTGGDYG